MEVGETARIAAEGAAGYSARQSSSSTCLLGEVVTFIGGSGWFRAVEA